MGGWENITPTLWFYSPAFKARTLIFQFTVTHFYRTAHKEGNTHWAASTLFPPLVPSYRFLCCTASPPPLTRNRSLDQTAHLEKRICFNPDSVIIMAYIFPFILLFLLQKELSTFKLSRQFLRKLFKRQLITEVFFKRAFWHCPELTASIPRIEKQERQKRNKIFLKLESCLQGQHVL